MPRKSFCIKRFVDKLHSLRYLMTDIWNMSPYRNEFTVTVNALFELKERYY